MNVCRLAERVPPCPGGKEIHVQELSLRQAGEHQIDVLYAFGDSIGSPVNSVAVRRWWPRALQGTVAGICAFAVSATWKVLSLARTRHYEVIHAHGDFVEAWAAIVLKRRLGVPAVLTVHGGLSSRWVSTLARAVQALDAVICVGSSIREQLIAAGAVEHSLHVISSGVDYKRVTEAGRTPVRAVTGQPRLLFAGTIEAVKGLDVLLRAFELVRQVNVKARLYIAGDGPDRRALEQERRDGVMFLGRLERDFLYSWLHAVDVVVVPSRRLASKAEGLPTIVLEAMAAGRPVVASDTGSIKEIINNRTGFLVPPDHPTALAAALTQASEPGPSNQFDPTAAHAVAASRDWGQVSERVTAVLQGSIGRSSRG